LESIRLCYFDLWGKLPRRIECVPLAKKYDAPIILTTGSNLPSNTKETLINLQVKNAFIIGGTGVIPSSIDTELESMKINVTRVAGQDRYDTSIKLAQRLPSPTEIFVVTGEDYPDALSIAPFAAFKQEPIILIPKDYLPESVKLYLTANNITKTYVVGDKDIINDNVFNQLPSPERILGTDKYVRNINVNMKFDNLFSTKDICIATGEGFADALTGTAYVAKKGIPKVQYKWFPGYSYKLYGIEKNTTRYFKATAVKNGVESDYSNVASATTASSTTDAITPTIHGPLKLIADDSSHTYLGKLTTNKFDSESVFNEFGTYGNKFNSKSIYNEFGTFGGEFSQYSPFNEFTSKPPLIVDADGNIVGRLSVNKFVIGAISPYIIFDTLTKLGF